MPWWGWVIVGLVLLGSELLIVDAAFYLVFVGIAAIVTGLMGLLGLGLQPWAQWLVFAALALMAMVFFRGRVYQMFRGTTADYDAGLVGEIVRLEESLMPGDSCRLTYRGTTWSVVNRGSEMIPKGTDVKVQGVNGLTLIVSGSATT